MCQSFSPFNPFGVRTTQLPSPCATRPSQVRKEAKLFRPLAASESQHAVKVLVQPACFQDGTRETPRDRPVWCGVTGMFLHIGTGLVTME